MSLELLKEEGRAKFKKVSGLFLCFLDLYIEDNLEIPENLETVNAFIHAIYVDEMVWRVVYPQKKLPAAY